MFLFFSPHQLIVFFARKKAYAKKYHRTSAVRPLPVVEIVVIGFVRAPIAVVDIDSERTKVAIMPIIIDTIMMRAKIKISD